MARTIIGGLAAGLVLFAIGFLFWASPLSRIAYSSASEVESAAVQTALAQNLGRSGTGTYVVPSQETAQGVALYERGPVATVHFNSRGFHPQELGSAIAGLVFALISGLLIAFALAGLGAAWSFAERARLVVLFSVGITFWTILAQPIFHHHGWTYWVYSFVSQTAALIAAGLVAARWFMPHARQAPADAPTEV